MKPESKDLQVLRTLILKSQCESLSESEIIQLNELVQSEGGAHEAAALIDQMGALADSSALDSSPMDEVLSEAFGGSGLSQGQGEGPVGNGMTRPAEGWPASPEARQSNPVANSTESSVFQPFGQTQRTGYGAWVLALVASHLFVGSLAWSLSRPAPSIIQEATRVKDTISPQLVSMTACVWRASGNAAPTLGAPIEKGEVLSLIEGIAEMKVGESTPAEAVVRIEGPASVFIRADGQLGLHHGSLTVKSLGTGSANVAVDMQIGEVLIDGQSSIGLVSNGSKNEIHVFTGQATVHPTQSASRLTVIRLEDGEAVRFSSALEEDEGAVLFEASLSSFVSARSSGFDPLNIGEEYVQAVLKSKPSVYWRFESLSGEYPYRVVNQGSAPDMDALIMGESGWRSYGMNRVAELGKLGTTSAFRSSGVWPPEPLDEYTIEMWVKPELYHHGQAFCMHESTQEEDGRFPHSLMIETLARHWRNPLEKLPPNRFRFVHRSPASGEVTEGSNLTGAEQYQVRTWQHLVAQKRGDRVLLWLDGHLSAEQLDGTSLVPEMLIVLGQLYLTRSERRFVGQLDEVAIYDRCLSQQELKTHIDAAGRSVAKSPE